MTDDMLSWLRQQVEGRMAIARAATQGGWEIDEPMPYSDPNSGIGIATEGDEVAGPGHSGGGVWRQEDAAHIACNDPRQIIADCEFDLSVLEEHRSVGERDPEHGYREPACYGCAFNAVEEYRTPDARDCPVVRRLAYRFRHRPGYRPEWAPEGTTP